MRKIASDVIDALRAQPLALALVIINVFVLVGLVFLLREISTSIARKDAIIKDCIERKL